MSRSLAFVLVLSSMLVGCGAADDPDAAPWLGEAGDGVLREAVVDVEGEPARVQVEDFGGTYVLDGDILLDPSQVQFIDEGAPELEQAMVAVRRRNLWPDGIVYYRFASTLPRDLRDRAQRAMDAWERRTVIRFRHAPAGRDAFVLITHHDASYCAATNGYWGVRTHVILSRACDLGATKHEFGHTIGLYHEHSRTDRGEHIRILWDNIDDGRQEYFRTYVMRGQPGRHVGDYNIRSIMHYGSTIFSRNGRPTMVRKDGSTFGRREFIHWRDAEGVDRIYDAVMD